MPDSSEDRLSQIADVLIPPTGDWPAPSFLKLGQDLLARLRKQEAEVVTEAVQEITEGINFSALAASEQVDRVRMYEAADPSKFETLRRAVYFAYYAQPAVIWHLRQLGYDINESPQPMGYHMDPFTPEQVEGVDTSRKIWIPAERVGETLRTAS